jgi:hypothetical protein
MMREALRDWNMTELAELQAGLEHLARTLGN